MFDKIVFNYNCASLPPQYYRSYSIEITQKQGNIRIYNYSEDLVAKNFEVNENEWKILSQVLIKSLEPKGEKIEEGATGTSCQTIILLKDNVELYKFSWDSLSDINANTQKFQENIAEVIKPCIQELLESIR